MAHEESLYGIFDAIMEPNNTLFRGDLMTIDVLSLIRSELAQQVDEKTKASYQRYFKEGVTAYGVKSSLVTKIAAKYYPQVKPLGKKEIFRLCEELLKSDFNEEAFIACEWSYRIHSLYEPDDFPMFERWIEKYINNWAKCDTLCNHSVGALVDKYPQYISNLKQWAKSENRWLRRAAAVTLIIPAKRGKFLKDIFEIADILLTDADDLVQKGYGWLLKDASLKHQIEIFDYVMKYKTIMPRTALRYAIERMPAELKQKAMAK
jgi:3-methyladenine DNA glycosylase AlkD